MTAPTLFGLTSSVTFAENTVNAVPQRLDTNVTFAWGSVVGGTLTISSLLAEDRISIANLGSGAGQIGFNGTSVTYGGIAIGTANGGVGADFTVTLNTAADSAAVGALIQSLTYANVADNPTTTRDLTLRLVDANGQRATADVSATPSFVELVTSANPIWEQRGAISAYSDPAFADWDGDGDLDLAAGGFSTSLGPLLNIGTATTPVFAPITAASNPFQGIFGLGHLTPSFADLDGDGDLDLVVGQQYGALLAFTNTGTTTAPVFTALAGAANPFGSLGVFAFGNPTFVDFDGDRDLDLVMGGESGTLLTYRNTGTTTSPVFTRVTGAADPFSGIDVGTASAPAFADWDFDGDLDLVVGERFGTLVAFRNTGTATAPVFTATTGTANPFNGFDVGDYATPTFADLNGDGGPELVVGSFLEIRYFLNTTASSITVTVTSESDVGVTLVGTAGNDSFIGGGRQRHAARQRGHRHAERWWWRGYSGLRHVHDQPHCQPRHRRGHQGVGRDRHTCQHRKPQWRVRQ